MAKTNTEKGRIGEEMAVAFLRNRGLSILETNWRYHHLELDIIAQDGDILVFVEVKTRATSFFGNPEDAISPQKISRLLNASEAYIFEKDFRGDARFDVISIIMPYGKKPELEYFEDAFMA